MVRGVGPRRRVVRHVVHSAAQQRHGRERCAERVRVGELSRLVEPQVLERLVAQVVHRKRVDLGANRVRARRVHAIDGRLLLVQEQPVQAAARGQTVLVDEQPQRGGHLGRVSVVAVVEVHDGFEGDVHRGAQSEDDVLQRQLSSAAVEEHGKDLVELLFLGWVRLDALQALQSPSCEAVLACQDSNRHGWERIQK